MERHTVHRPLERLVGMTFIVTPFPLRQDRNGSYCGDDVFWNGKLFCKILYLGRSFLK